MGEQERRWEEHFPKLIVLIIGIIEVIWTILIFVLEIASLAVLIYQPTGVGIWASIAFLTASILTIILGKKIFFFLISFKYFHFVLVRKKNGSKDYSTRVLIAQIILVIFSIILIGITGNYVQTGGYVLSYTYGYTLTCGSSSSTTCYTTKYQLVQAQLAFGVLMMFSGFSYIAIYIYLCYIVIWRPN